MIKFQTDDILRRARNDSHINSKHVLEVVSSNNQRVDFNFQDSLNYFATIKAKLNAFENAIDKVDCQTAFKTKLTIS